YIADSYYDLNDYDGVLATEEELIKRFPATRRFDTSRWRIKNAIEHKRKAAEGRAGKAQKEIAELSQDHRKDYCRVAYAWSNWECWREAVQAAERCHLDAEDPKTEADALRQLAYYSYKMSDFAAARRALAKLRALNVAEYEKERFLEDERMSPP